MHIRKTITFRHVVHSQAGNIYIIFKEVNTMFNNVGDKIKGLAMTTFIIGTIAAVLLGIAVIVVNEELALVGVLIIGLGILIAWLSNLLLYGFGELVEKTCEIARNTSKAVSDNDRLDQAKQLRNQGLITDDEYRQIIAKK